MCARKKTENNVTLDPLDKLIQIEWDTIHSLVRLLKSARYTKDKVRISNSIAYHANCLNKLLVQKGESPLDDENLGAILTKIPKKWRSSVLRDFRRWKRRHSLIV